MVNTRFLQIEHMFQFWHIHTNFHTPYLDVSSSLEGLTYQLSECTLHEYSKVETH